MFFLKIKLKRDDVFDSLAFLDLRDTRRGEHWLESQVHLGGVQGPTVLLKESIEERLKCWEVLP